MKRWIPFLLPFSAIVAAGLGAWVILHLGDGRCTEVTDTAFAALLDGPECVALEGTAHFETVVKQTTAAGLFREEAHRYLFPLFPSDDTEGREIRVLVLAERPPERLVTYEHMVVEGRRQRATPELVPYRTEIELGKAGGYFFADEMVLIVADAITSDGERWERPE